MVIAPEAAGKLRQCFAQGYEDRLRQHRSQVRWRDAGLIRRGNRAQRRGRTTGQKILQPLRRGGIGSTPTAEGPPLQIPLQRNPRQGITRMPFVGLQILGFEGHHQAAVGIALIAGVLAHAVGHHPPLLRGGPHHKTARTHAEAVNAAAIAGVMNKLVFRRAKPRMARHRSPAGLIDQGLRVLDPHTNRKRFALQLHPHLIEHGETVPGRMAGRQHEVTAGQLLTIGQQKSLQAEGFLAAAGLQQQTVHTTTEAHLTPQGFDARTQATHHGGQLEGADMRPMHREDFGVGTASHQLLKHLASVVLGIAHLAVELAVGKGAGTPLPELGIGFRIKGLLPPPEGEGLLGPLLHRLPTLQQQGLKPHLRQQQRSEIAAGAGTDHHGACLQARRRLRHHPVAGVRCLFQRGAGPAALHQRLLMADQHINAVNQLDAITAAGIDAALDQSLLQQLIRRNLQTTQYGLRELLLGVIQRQLQLSQSQHQPACHLPSLDQMASP